MYPDPVPSAPPLLELMKNEPVEYNCEEGCDVEFHVGKGGADRMRIPAHSCKLMEFPFFKALLCNNIACDGRDDTSLYPDLGGICKLRQFCIDDVDGKAFDNLLKFIYKKPLNLESQAPELTVETLKAAHQYLLNGLVRVCVKHLSKIISAGNVLYIYAHTYGLCSDVERLEDRTKASKQLNMSLPKRTKPSTADPAHKYKTHQSPAGLEMKNLCVWLLCQCLAFIDVHAAEVLKLDDFENLCEDSLSFLLKRDSLIISESDVFSALIRWAETQCKRRQLRLTPEFKRLVLQDNLYLVRFLMMSAAEFVAGPGESDLLSNHEVQVIKSVLQNARRGQCQCSHYRISASQLRYCQCLGEDVLKLKSHWKYLCTPRNFMKVGGGGMAEKPKLSLKRRNSLRKVGGIVKSFCLPCVTANNPEEVKRKRLSTHEDKSDQSSQAENSKMEGEGNKAGNGAGFQRRQSTMSKMLDYTLRTFAFFFD